MGLEIATSQQQSHHVVFGAEGLAEVEGQDGGAGGRGFMADHQHGGLAAIAMLLPWPMGEP